MEHHLWPEAQASAGALHMLARDPGQVTEPFLVLFLHLNQETTIPTSETLLRVNRENLGTEHHVKDKSLCQARSFGRFYCRYVPSLPLSASLLHFYSEAHSVDSLQQPLGQEPGNGAHFTFSQASSWEGLEDFSRSQTS